MRIKKHYNTIHTPAPSFQGGAPGYFYTSYFYDITTPVVSVWKNYYAPTVEVPRSPNGFFGTSKSRWRFQKRNGCYETVSEAERVKMYNGYVTECNDRVRCNGICNGRIRWPKAEAKGAVVWGSLTYITSVRPNEDEPKTPGPGGPP